MNAAGTDPAPLRVAAGGGAPAVSICIPVYNGAPHVDAAIRSALGQSFEDFELVVLDNASTDRTPEIVAGFADPRIRVLRNDRTVGMAENWNRAVAAARAPLVKILPADDLLYPTCLERQVAALSGSGNERVVMANCSRDVIDDRGRVLTRRGYPGRPGRRPGTEGIRAVVRSGSNVIGEPGAVLLRADALRAALPFDDRVPLVIDLDLWFRLLLRGDLAVEKDALCAFRVSPISLSVGVRRTQGAQFRAFLKSAARDPGVGVTDLDRLRGILLASVKSQMKRVFYLVHVRQGRAGARGKGARRG